MKRTYIWFMPAIAVALGIFLLSTFLTIPIQVEGGSGIDKWEHAFGYMVLSVAFLVAFRKADRMNQQTFILVLVSCVFYGYLLELVQYYFFSYRYFEWLDALANAIGVVLGSFLYGLLKLTRRV